MENVWSSYGYFMVGNYANDSTEPTLKHLVREWTLGRQQQLRENWRRARAGEQPERIAGLDVD